jgi:hypothetical protein
VAVISLSNLGPVSLAAALRYALLARNLAISSARTSVPVGVVRNIFALGVWLKKEIKDATLKACIFTLPPLKRCKSDKEITVMPAAIKHMLLACTPLLGRASP